MTATQMGYEFDVGYDRIANFDAPGYTSKEKSTFLTEAQEQLVLEILEGNSYLDKHKRVLDVLKTNEEVLAAAMAAGPYPNSFWADLPTSPYCIRLVNERATLTPSASHFYTGQVFTDVKVKPIDDDYYHANKNNPHKKPSHKLVWSLSYGEDDSGWKGKQVYIVEANQVLTSVQMHFYRKPAPIIIGDSDYTGDTTAIDGEDWADYDGPTDLDCELNQILHREIVDRAIKLAFAALQEEKGFQLSSAMEK